MSATPDSATPRKPWWRVLGVLALIACLVLAIGYTPVESAWLLAALMLGLIYAAVPLLLLSLRDALAHSWAAWQQRRGRRSALSPGRLLLHICALFALVLGGLLACLLPGEPPAGGISPWWLMVVMPALVYATPVFLVLNGGLWRGIWHLFRR